MGHIIKKVLTHDKHEICASFDSTKGLVELGGNLHLKEKIWSHYLHNFKECDGEPHFYYITRGKTRIKFRCNMKSWLFAMSIFKKQGYDNYDVKSFERRM